LKGCSHRLRKGRISIAGQIYHIRFTILNRQTSLSFEAGRVFAKALNEVAEELEFELMCWVAMPDHIHMLIRLKNGESLGRVVRLIKGRSSKLINEYLGRSGSFWQPGYFDRAIREEEDVATVARYIVANPVRAGIARSVREYPLWDAIWV
jgi:REP element-mobilizing transposase RayT